MKIIFLPEKLHSNKKNEDYYCVKLGVCDDKNNILQKSNVLMWITKEQYENLISSK